MKKRCAWYLRVKLKPHNELPYSEGEEFLEVMSMDQRAGVWIVEEGGGSSSSGPAFHEDVEEGEPVKKLMAPTAPKAEEHTASGHAIFRTWCRECCIGRGRVHQHRAGGKETTFPAVALDNGYLNERDDLLQDAAGASILVSKCNRDRWIGAAIVPTKGADEYAVAELKNDVIGSGFTGVLVRSDNEPAIFALKESAATALNLADVKPRLRRVHCAIRKATDWPLTISNSDPLAPRPKKSELHPFGNPPRPDGRVNDDCESYGWSNVVVQLGWNVENFHAARHVKRTSPDTENHEQNGYANLYDDNNIFMTNMDNDNSDTTYNNMRNMQD